MPKFFNYDSREILLATALVERDIKLAHRIVHIRVPIGQSAGVRFGQPDAPIIPLQSGWQRFCFPEPPGELFLTAAAGLPIRLFTSEDIQGDFFSEGADPAPGQEGGTRYDLTWEPTRIVNLNQGQTVKRNWFGRDMSDARDLWGGIDALITWEIYKSVPCARINSRAQGMAAAVMSGNGGLGIQPMLRETDLVTGFDDDWYNVSRLQFILAREFLVTGNLSTIAGIYYQLQASPTQWTSGRNAGYFGLVADGADGWLFQSRVGAGGPADYSTALVWPGSVYDWVLFEIRIIGATPLEGAKVQLYANRSLLIERSWSSHAGTLPVFTGAGIIFVPGISSGVGGPLGPTEDDRMYVTHGRMIQTRHTPL